MQTNVKSIDDMRSFMDKYPAFRSKSHSVSKHVTITSELSRLVETCNLFEISALEQDLACSNEHNKQYRELSDMLKAPEISAVDKLRLGLLYALRYETSSDLVALKNMMVAGGVPRAQVDLVDKMLLYAGQVTPLMCLVAAAGLNRGRVSPLLVPMDVPMDAHPPLACSVARPSDRPACTVPPKESLDASRRVSPRGWRGWRTCTPATCP